MEEMDWGWIRQQPEGQFLERKGCYDYSQGGERPRRRQVRDVAWDIAETLSAMANADGGHVVVGVEDDGTVSGVDYPEDRLNVLLEVPRTHIIPPLRPHIHQVVLEGRLVLIFYVDWSPEVHHLCDGRYLLRIGDRNEPFPAEQIEAIKAGKRRRLVEGRFISDASLSDLATELLDQLRRKTGLNLPDPELLRHYRLVESRNGRFVLSMAALLLFARDPLRWHPASYVDFVKWEGKEQRFGAELNVIKRERIEGPLPYLIEATFRTIWPHIRQRQRLVDLFFEERFEYPTFAWQEAIINAVAHRDYGLEGTPIEIWLFDDRMEIRSPGQLVEPVTLDHIRNRERIHASRNPRIVRVLTDLGYMRQLGEGIPRMFEVMEREGLRPPEFNLEGGVIFTVTLRNVVVYPPETIRWLHQFEDWELTANQKRLLAYAHAHGGKFTSRNYQKLVGVDIYTASRDIKELVRKGIARLTRRGGRVYEIITPGEHLPPLPEEFADLGRILKEKGYLTSADVQRVRGVSRTTAWRLLTHLVQLGILVQEGKRRNVRYVPRQMFHSQEKM